MIISLSEYFTDSQNQWTYRPLDLSNRIDQFVIWKSTGIKQGIDFKDKSSEKDSNGVVFKPYKINQFRHCHTGLKPNGDPLIVYRLCNGGDTIKLVCISTHDEMFEKTRRDFFVKKYKNEFPREE